MSIAGFRATNHPQQTGKRGASDEVDDRGTTPEMFAPLHERFRFTLDVAAAPHNAKCERYYTRLDDGLVMPWGRARWQGEPCQMCYGTGRDRRAVTVTSGPFELVTGYAETGERCRACNGHGRSATDGECGSQRVWCNPPYSDIGAWVRKAWDEWDRADGPWVIVMLLPANRTEQGWWQDHVEPHLRERRTDFRVEFLRGRPRFIRPNAVIGPKGDRPPFGCCLLIWGKS